MSAPRIVNGGPARGTFRCTSRRDLAMLRDDTDVRGVRLEGSSIMRTQRVPFRFVAAAAIFGLLYGQVVPPALAQAPPPPPGAQLQQQGDPPARVGRLAGINGSVSYHGQEDSEWSPASVNLPVQAGNAFWTQPGAQADVEVSATRITMAPETELDIATLDDSNFQGIEPQGATYLRVRAADPSETYSVQTPRGLVSFSAPGRYEVVSGSTDAPTLVTVVDGSAQITGPDLSLQVGPNQTATLTGTDTFQGTLGPGQPDTFLNAMLARDRPPPRPAVAPPPAVAAMPGGDDLAQYGTWSDTPEYGGAVWYPQVAADWVPYRDGHWAYIAPWGWTWVDDAPWGFAPFHYGRWASIGGRWGWVPGYAVAAGPVYPVYAPALVTFFGVAAGVALGVGIGAALAGGRIGWCPLGPREAFHPWYRASDRYVRQVNITHVTNVTNITTINRNVTINNFANARAATVVPAAAMTTSRPVRQAVQRVDPAQLAQAHPVVGQSPLRPTSATAGVTPAVARQLALPASAAPHPVAPGPAIRPMPAGVTAGAAGAAGAVHPPPPLHNPAAPAVAGVRPLVQTPGAPGAPGAHQPVAAGATAMPALRAPTAPGHAAPPPVTHIPTPAATGPVVHPPSAPGTAGAPPPATTGAPPVHAGAQPGAIPHTAPQFAAPAHPAPTVQTPPQTQLHAVTPPPVVHTPPPAPAVHAPSPAAVQAPPPVVHTPPPAPQVHTPPPAPVVRAPPPPAPHPAPPPPAVQVHAPPPPPAPHPAPPPPAPAVHAAPTPQPQPQQQQHKRPGEP